MGRKRTKYPREFKVEAVKQLESGEHTQSELARRLGVPLRQLIRWRSELARKQDDAFPGQGKQGGAAAELARLKRELEQVKEERDILKKAMVFFAKESK
jgi:transposase